MSWASATIFAVAAVVLLLPVGTGADHAPSATVSKSDLRASHVGLAGTAEGRSVTGRGAAMGLKAIPSSVPSVGPQSVAGPVAHGPAATTSPTVDGKFVGLKQTNSGGFLPPDTQVAQNGSYVFEIVNEKVRITSTSGSTVYAAFTTNAAWGLPRTDNVGDVQVAYDNVAKRWMYSADDFTTNSLYLAVSMNSSPLSSYWTFGFGVLISGDGGQYLDQPVLGFSKTMVGLSVQDFNSTFGSFDGSLMVVLNEHKLAKGIFSAQYLGWTYESVVPARESATNGTGTDILFAATTESAGSSTQLGELELSGTVGTLSTVWVYYTIANTGSVPGAVQPGTTTLVNTGDDRVESIGWAAGVLWVSFTTACTPSGDASVRSCIRVDGIYTPTNALQQDTDTAVAGAYLYYGALAPITGSASGYLMVMSYSSSLDYPSIAISGQNTSDLYGTYRGPIPVVTGTAADTSGRFGDYSGCQLQFSGTKVTAWGAAEYGTSSGWATEVVHISFY